MYWIASTDEVHSEETRLFSLQMNAREKKMSLLDDAMIKILRTLADGGSAIFDAGGFVQGYMELL